MLDKMLRPDSKGRITLTKDHKIILKPYTEILGREKWLFMHKTALEKIDQGLKDAASGRLVDKGSFSKFQEDDIE